MIEYFTKHTAWYWERFFHHSSESKNYKEAYERTEAEHLERFQFNKYEEYQAFRTAKGKWIEKMQGKRKPANKNQMELF